MTTPATNIQPGPLTVPMAQNSNAAGYYIRYDLPSGVYSATVPCETMLHDVEVAVHEANNSTSPSLKIGDSDNDAGYAATADINLAATAGTVVNAATSGEAYAKGRYYPTKKDILFTWVRGTVAGSPTGLTVILLRFTVMSAWNRHRNVG